MSDTLKIYGNTYTGIESIKAEDSNGNELTYIRPQGSKSITDNGTGIDVAAYATVNVSVSGGGGGNEFIITVSKNNQTGYWEPDCTWADLLAAYNGGKTIAFKTDDPVDCQVDLAIINTVDSALDNVQYITNELFDDGQEEDYWVVQQVYTFDASGLTKEDEYTYYDPYLADATSSDLLSGKIAYGQNGRITGSATARTSSDLSVSGNTVTAPAGFYSSSASASVASGTEGTPTATKGTVSNHSVSVTPSVTNSAGYISGGTHTGTAVTVTASELESGTKSISANGTNIDVTGYAAVDVAVPSSAPNLQAKTNIDPLTSSQTVQPDSGYDGLSSVQINAMPSGSVETPNTTIEPYVSINVISSTGVITATASGSALVFPRVTTPGYVVSGSYGTITVDGYGTTSLTTQAAQTIHPSASDQTIARYQYLTGAQTIKAVTMSNLTADNIKSGVTVEIGDSTDSDCVASVTGTYTGGSSKNIQVYSGYASRTANSYGATNVTLTVAKAGTYKITWMAWRGSSSGTMGTNLHIGSTAEATNHTTWTGTYGQCITLNNQNLTKNQVLTLYATSGSNSRTIYVGNLIIEEI